MKGMIAGIALGIFVLSMIGLDFHIRDYRHNTKPAIAHFTPKEYTGIVKRNEIGFDDSDWSYCGGQKKETRIILMFPKMRGE